MRSGSHTHAESGNGRQTVFLLHGLGRTKRSLRALEQHLQRTGYRTVNLDYPSRKLDIETIADRHLAPAVERAALPEHGPLHFVGHSLGGIVIRQYLRGHAVPDGGRFVMIGPPNGGSELVDHLMGTRWFQWVMGPAALQLGTAQNSVLHQLGPAPVPVGIIAGAKSCLPFSRRIFHGPNDGKVAVERTRLAGMADFLVLPFGHTFMASRPEVLDEVTCFLRRGRFGHRV